jgi:chemotaxis protein methyltransferase CheR
MWSDPVLGQLSRELYRRCGLVFDGGQAALFRKRVQRRADELGYPDVGEYVSDLASGGEQEYERLIEILTVNETYFFREEEHFSVLLGELWPAWLRGRDNPIRVWSAACSIGCEPYTLAILLKERGLTSPDHPRVEILATDVNGRVIEDASHGAYGEFSLRATPPYYKQKYFKKHGHKYQLDPDVRQMVAFRRYNLLRPGPSGPRETVHAIFCRNVLIYFDLAAKRKAVRMLGAALQPGGVLFIGRSESLFNVPEAPPVAVSGGVLYHRKPG